MVYLKSVDKLDRDKDHNLFKGSSCNPISPMPSSDPNESQTIDTRDQFILILGACRDQNTEGSVLLEKEEMRRYV